MAKRNIKKVPDDQPEIKSPPVMTPEARENQLISLAIDLAEQQLRNGTASSQVITHYLKLGSSKEKLEKEILQEQKKLVVAKTSAIESQERIDELYAGAIAAMRSYNGQSEDSGDV
jgi:hypothetical protein